MPFIAESDLRKYGWASYDSKTVRDLNKCLTKYHITNSASIRHFLAQCARKTTFGRNLLELNPTGDGFGNREPNDREKFKGAGYLQLCGRGNYQAFADEIRDSNVMIKGANYVKDNYPWESGAWFWNANGINVICENGGTVEDVSAVVDGRRGNDMSYANLYYKKACECFKNLPEPMDQ